MLIFMKRFFAQCDAETKIQLLDMLDNILCYTAIYLFVLHSDMYGLTQFWEHQFEITAFWAEKVSWLAAWLVMMIESTIINRVKKRIAPGHPSRPAGGALRRAERNCVRSISNGACGEVALVI